MNSMINPAETASTGRLIAYCRVSRVDQNPELQLNALKALNCDLTFTEEVSAVGKARPAFKKALKALRPSDTFCVWKLDRAFRSTREAIDVWDDLRQRDIKFMIATLGILSDTPEGRYFYRGLASAAEFERDMISVRTREGMAVARKQGKRLGRPHKLDDFTVQEIRRLMNHTGMCTAVAARLLGVSHITLAKAIERVASPA